MSYLNLILLAAGMLLLIMLISCSLLPHDISSDDISPPEKVKNVETQKALENQNWVIFDEESAEETAEEIEMASVSFMSDGFWTPSVDEVIKVEGKISEYLSLNSNQFYWQPPIWQRFDEYQRQYFGLERGGRQIIYGNFFCDSGKINWRQEFVFAIDGGECYFQVEYDVESELLIELRVNGES